MDDDMIREVIAYEVTCDCGKKDCKERLFLGTRLKMVKVQLAMNCWKISDGRTLSPRCEIPKKAPKKGKAK